MRIRAQEVVGGGVGRRHKDIGKEVLGSSEDSSYRDVKSGASQPGGLPSPDLLNIY